ncbi:transaldolase [Acidihalobacter ferrooxydans]|uniref:Transaldolase n=1 Tax=Acidihalobacter ferrooxydans TaxID=1765967 RepID=A0A1P8UJU6_9GAMM|nr:transaldolase [Acidihalobacter ferrooxydans]APZ44123.1 transaldolase [Acidihalobacter ferrooxydans]
MTHPAPLQPLTDLGQSIWLDYIRRDMFADGSLRRMIETDGLRGMTSNPSIFDKAIADTELYDEALRAELARDAHQSNQELFFRLAIDDVRQALDLFAPVYEASGHTDGFVSLEVSPELARDTDATVREAKALWRQVERPNLMIKVPATREGIPAIRELLEEGLNINVTLLFSIERYRAVLDAYLDALESRLAKGQPLAAINSVASFFVSRVDVKLDAALEADGSPDALALRGHCAVANAKLAYAHLQHVMAGERWQRLAAADANAQRLLWASTSTKNPDYPPLLYVDTLVGPHTVNTLPPATYERLLHTPLSEVTIDRDLDAARGALQTLERLGIDLDAVTDQLEQEGVTAFSEAFRHLLGRIDERRAQLKAAS